MKCVWNPTIGCYWLSVTVISHAKLGEKEKQLTHLSEHAYSLPK